MTEAQIDRLVDHVKSYKARQDLIVASIGEIQMALAKSDVDEAQILIAQLLETNLKQSRDRVYAQYMAMRIAVETLRSIDGPSCCARHSNSSSRDCDRGMAKKALDLVASLISETAAATA